MDPELENQAQQPEQVELLHSLLQNVGHQLLQALHLQQVDDVQEILKFTHPLQCDVIAVEVAHHTLQHRHLSLQRVIHSGIRLECALSRWLSTPW